MAKNVNVVWCIIEGGTPEFTSFHSPADAAVFFKKKVKELMTGKMSSHYKGVTPVPGYFHKVTPSSYELWHLSGSGAKLMDVVCKIGTSTLYKAGESTDGAKATASPGTVTAASPAPAPASSPAGVVGPKGVPGPKGTPPKSGVPVPGVGDVDADALATVLKSIASSAGGGLPASVMYGNAAADEDGDEDGDGEFNEEDDD